jgi:manganese/zinc/iron transport system substrate-binding protein
MADRSQVVAVTDSISKDLLRMPQEFEGFYDPHVWFDIRLWKNVLNSVELALISADPKNKASYQANAQRYHKELESLLTFMYSYVEQVPSPQRVLVTAHDAFGYFGEAFGFEVYGLQGISTQAEAAIFDVNQLASFIAMRKIPAIFVESSISKRQIIAVQEAVKAKGWQVAIGGELFSDALGAKNTPEGTYIGMLKHNVTTIVNGLKETP